MKVDFDGLHHAHLNQHQQVNKVSEITLIERLNYTIAKKHMEHFERNFKVHDFFTPQISKKALLQGKRRWEGQGTGYQKRSRLDFCPPDFWLFGEWIRTF